MESLGDNVFTSYDPAWRVVPEAPPPTPAAGPGITDRNTAAGFAITPQTCRSLGGGEPYDLGLAVEALVMPHGKAVGDAGVAAA